MTPVRYPFKVDEYHVLDARDLHSLLRGEERVDVTITSPPYWNIRDYGSSEQIGYGQSYDVYLNDLEKVFRAVYAATKRTGSLWLIADTIKIDGELRLLPFDIAERLRRSEWILQDIIIWQKDRTLPWSHQGKLRNIFEYIAFYTKSHRFKYHVNNVRELSDLKDYWVRYPERYNPHGKAPSRTWQIAIPRQGSWGKAANYVRHACPLPTALVERILRLTTDRGDLVLDPFAGSGAVLATAIALNRRFVGVDLSAKSREMFLERVLPGIKERYRQCEPQRTAAAVRRKFADTILSLRALKYPRELLRLYRKSYEPVRCRSVWVLRHKANHHVTIAFDFARDSDQPIDFLAKARALCAVKPLSKYGIDVSLLTTASSAELSSALRDFGLRPRTRIYAYRDGRFYRWKTAGTLISVFDTLNGVSSKATNYPPLYSSLDVRIDAHRPQQGLAQIDNA